MGPRSCFRAAGTGAPALVRPASPVRIGPVSLLALAALLVGGPGCSGSPPLPDAGHDLASDAAGTDSAELGAALPAPSIDGEQEDWREVPVLASDPAGDATGGFDLRVLKATSRGSTLYLSVEITQAVNAHGGPVSEGTLLIHLSGPGGRLTIDLRGRSAYTDGDPLKKLGWSELGYLLAPSVASRSFELRLELGRIGAALGDTIQIDFGGSDALASPVPFELRHPPVQPTRRSPARLAGTTLRVASLNTWFDGLTDPTRSAAMGRLLKATAAEVYCLQELFTTPGPLVAERLRAIDPHGDGATWTVQQHRDLAIAFRGALQPLPLESPEQPFTAAALEVGGRRLVIFTLRPTCCGFIGSPEDVNRIAELSRLALTIKKLREGSLGAELLPWKSAALVVMGDWNLVGSRQPLDLLLDPAGPALSEWLLRHLLGDDVFTWRNDGDKSNFPAGRLDLLVHSPGLQRRNGYVLDTRDLEPAVASGLQLRAEDSLASDHLLLVADFEL